MPKEERKAKIKDPATGATRAEKSGVAMSAKGEKRNTRVGMYSGPRPSYVPYQVSEQAQDILNRQFRNYK